ncbi:MAG TPA: GNAT family N-acetyltransferase [Dehalococcoidia bacterium]|nr:GNAT family N-acetyltransferase [Dehalococcoidia bacterium]
MRLEKSQLEPASEVLARAFFDDPALVPLVPEPHKRIALLRSLFRVSLGHAIKHGEVYSISPKMEGVAVWLPSGIPEMTLWQMLRSGGPGLLFRVSWKLLWKMKKDETFASRLRRRLAPTPHWYLAVLGVDPKFQGKGYASRLMKPMLKKLDAGKMPCYLETSTEEYVSIYRHFGFKMVYEAELPGSGSPMWAMVREKGG